MERLYCQDCGAEIRPTALFCYSCGAKLGKSQPNPYETTKLQSVTEIENKADLKSTAPANFQNVAPSNTQDIPVTEAEKQANKAEKLEQLKETKNEKKEHLFNMQLVEDITQTKKKNLREETGLSDEEGRLAGATESAQQQMLEVEQANKDSFEPADNHENSLVVKNEIESRKEIKLTNANSETAAEYFTQPDSNLRFDKSTEKLSYLIGKADLLFGEPIRKPLSQLETKKSDKLKTKLITSLGNKNVEVKLESYGITQEKLYIISSIVFFLISIIVLLLMIWIK